MVLRLNDSDSSVIEIEDISMFYKTDNSQGEVYRIKIYQKSNPETQYYNYSSEGVRDEDYDKILSLKGGDCRDMLLSSPSPFSSAFNSIGSLGNLQQQQYAPPAMIYPSSTSFVLNTNKPTKKEESKMFGVKNYIEKHKDILFTLGLVVLVDHFMFKGALRSRIQKSIEGVLAKVEDKFNKEV